jgi:ribosome biogenesis protein ENP2
MEVTATNGVKVYNVSAGKAVPLWLQEKKKKDKAYQKGLDKVQLELIQEFGFPMTATKIKQSGDGQLIFAAGVYPPMVKAFSTEDLSLKFKRHLDADVVNFEILSEDFSKLVFLRSDRTFEFHGRAGVYYKTRMPIFGSDMAYHYPTCDLVTVGNSNLIYRLNLEQGRFLRPLDGSSPAINVCALNPASGILAVGGNDGVLECWDPRDRAHLATMKIETRFLEAPVDTFVGSHGLVLQGQERSATSHSSGITALRFSPDGLSIGCGMASGHALLYDLRMNIPFLEKDHQFDTPITDIHFHEASRSVISSCRKIIRVWDKDTAKTFVNVEPSFDITTTHVVPNTGMIMVGGENPRMNIYYIPDLAPAPKWAAFLDNMTDELEGDAKQAIYQDFKFITREEIDRLGINKLIGTPYLRAQGHGFFIDFRLYKKVRDIARPDEYREYLKQRVQEQMDKKRGSRISAQPTVKLGTKVNQEYLDSVEAKRGSTVANNLVSDPRFARVFQDPSMKIDTTSEAYQRTNPMAFAERLNKFEDADAKRPSSGYESDEVDDDVAVDAYGFTDEDAGKSERRDDRKGKRTRTAALSDPISKRSSKDGTQDHDEEDSDGIPPRKKQLKLMEASEQHDSPFQASEIKRKRLNQSFATRLVTEDFDTTDSKVAAMGPLQMTFIPEADKKVKYDAKQARVDRQERNKGRRSMKGVRRHG